jgi:hypothetical protein
VGVQPRLLDVGSAGGDGAGRACCQVQHPLRLRRGGAPGRRGGRAARGAPDRSGTALADAPLRRFRLHGCLACCCAFTWGSSGQGALSCVRPVLPRRCGSSGGVDAPPAHARCGVLPQRVPSAARSARARGRHCCAVGRLPARSMRAERQHLHAAPGCLYAGLLPRAQPQVAPVLLSGLPSRDLDAAQLSFSSHTPARVARTRWLRRAPRRAAGGRLCFCVMPPRLG